MSKEALKLALEALEICEQDGYIPVRLTRDSITAIKQALAAPAQEPVAHLWQHGETGRTRITMPGDMTDCDARWFKAAALYTTPPAAQPAPVQEPVETEDTMFRQFMSEANKAGITHWPTPPATQRQWVGLTAAEVDRCWNMTPMDTRNSRHMFAYSIEAKLKEKNT
jgi:hypothetical protein